MTKKNTSSKKKLLPAAGMLALSAAMLSSATFAWFTMSREVEVQNIQMTATVPEDLQLSVGVITNGTKLNDSDSYVTDNSTAPTISDMWSNTLDISQYYTLGKIIPASSTTGMNIYYTPNATVVGKTVSDKAQYIQAANGLVAVADANTAANPAGTYMTTLHSNTASEAETHWVGTRATSYDKTNDDGYYVDVPIWLRSSSKNDVSLSVTAYVTNKDDTKTNSEADIELYKAARVVIIDPTGTTSNTGGTASTSNIIDLKDGAYSGTTVIDYYGDKKNKNTGSAVTNGAVNAVGTLDTTDIYSAYTPYTANSAVCTVAGSGENADYGAAKKIYARVWLEGEDPQCWNQNAGQNFSINLKFSKIEAAPSNNTGD